jgi:hypothetical protein
MLEHLVANTRSRSDESVADGIRSRSILTTASGLLPAGTGIRRPAETNGVGLEIRYLVRQ